MSIHQEILAKVLETLQFDLVDNIHPDDTYRPGEIAFSYLQGDPDPEEARISITLHENDPDSFRNMGTTSSMTSPWNDVILDVEMGSGIPVITYRRRFSVLARCLLEGTGETLTQARTTASRVRQRIENSLIAADFSDVSSEGESVQRGAFEIAGEQLQSGGPEAYDYIIKVRFEVWTTTGVTT